jgi:hypothetical protein
MQNNHALLSDALSVDSASWELRGYIQEDAAEQTYVYIRACMHACVCVCVCVYVCVCAQIHAT